MLCYNVLAKFYIRVHKLSQEVTQSCEFLRAPVIQTLWGHGDSQCLSALSTALSLASPSLRCSQIIFTSVEDMKPIDDKPSSSSETLCHGAIQRPESPSSILRSALTSEGILRPPQPQRPPKWQLEATCTCTPGQLRSLSSNPRLYLTSKLIWRPPQPQRPTK